MRRSTTRTRRDAAGDAQTLCNSSSEEVASPSEDASSVSSSRGGGVSASGVSPVDAPRRGRRPRRCSPPRGSRFARDPIRRLGTARRGRPRVRQRHGVDHQVRVRLPHAQHLEPEVPLAVHGEEFAVDDDVVRGDAHGGADAGDFAVRAAVQRPEDARATRSRSSMRPAPGTTSNLGASSPGGVSYARHISLRERSMRFPSSRAPSRTRGAFSFAFSFGAASASAASRDAMSLAKRVSQRGSKRLRRTFEPGGTRRGTGRPGWRIRRELLPSYATYSG